MLPEFYQVLPEFSPRKFFDFSGCVSCLVFASCFFMGTLQWVRCESGLPNHVSDWLTKTVFTHSTFWFTNRIVRVGSLWKKPFWRLISWLFSLARTWRRAARSVELSFIELEGKEFFWLGKLELNLSSEERLEFSVGSFERGVLPASVLGDCYMLKSRTFHASYAVFFFVIERSERSENAFQRSFIFRDGHGARGDVVKKGEDLFVC